MSEFAYCPTCGINVEIVSDEEGNDHYAVECLPQLKEALTELDPCWHQNERSPILAATHWLRRLGRDAAFDEEERAEYKERLLGKIYDTTIGSAVSQFAVDTAIGQAIRFVDECFPQIKTITHYPDRPEVDWDDIRDCCRIGESRRNFWFAWFVGIAAELYGVTVHDLVTAMIKGDGWIPIKMGLPPNGEEVLAYVEHVDSFHIVLGTFYYGNKRWLIPFGFQVTHWRPKPQIPQ